MSASGATLMAALVTYTSSTFTSCAKTARKTVPASGNVPCSTSNSSNRIFFAFLTMPPIIAKATSQSRPKRTPERTPSSSALAQDVQRKDARPSSTTSQMTLPPCAHSRIDIPKRQKGTAGSKPAAPSFGIPYLRAIPAGAAAGQSARRSVRRPCGFGRQLPTWPGRA